MAKVCEQAQHFDIMTDYLEDLIMMKVQVNEDFTKEERNLISIGFKNWIGET